MRLEVIKQMFKDQYHLRDSDQIKIRHIFTLDNKSEYHIKDYRTVDGVTTEQETFITIETRRKDPIVLDIQDDCKCTDCYKTFSSKVIKRERIPKNINIVGTFGAGVAPTKLPICPHCGYMYFFGLPFKTK